MIGDHLTIKPGNRVHAAVWLSVLSLVVIIFFPAGHASSRAAESAGQSVIGDNPDDMSGALQLAVAQGTGGGDRITAEEKHKPESGDQELRLGDEGDGPAKATDQPLELSPLAISLAKQIGIDDRLKRLNMLKYRVARLEGKPYTLKTLALKYELTELRRELMKTIMVASLEVDSAIALIENDRSKNMDWLQRIRTRDERRLALAQRASAVANASLWSVQGAVNIPDVKRPSYALPSGIMSILGGVVPSAIDFAIVPGRTYSKLARLEQPNTLATIFHKGKSLDKEFPASVSSFLKDASPYSKGGEPRTEKIIDTWINARLIPKRKSRKFDRSVSIATNTTARRKDITAGALGARLAMLAEVRSVIYTMKKGLLELLQVI